MTAFWRRIVDEPDAFPVEFWQLFLQSSLTALGEKCRPVCVGMTWRRLITARAMRQWRPRLEEVNREVRQFKVAVPGGVELVGLRARTLHETGNWLVLTDCSNAFNTVKRKAVLAEAANCVPALTLFVAKCYGSRPADVFFPMDSGETRTIACSSGVQQGDPMGPAMFCLALRPGLKRFREEFEGEGAEAFAYMDDVSLGLTRITADTVGAFAFLRQELEDIGIVVNPAKTVAYHPKGTPRRRTRFRSLKAFMSASQAKEERRWWVSRSARTNTCWTERWR